MLPLKSHLTVLAETASRFPTSAAFRTPIVDLETNSITDWRYISFTQFQFDVELFAKYWYRTLTDCGVTQRSVVGLWFAIFPSEYCVAMIDNV